MKLNAKSYHKSALPPEIFTRDKMRNRNISELACVFTFILLYWGTMHILFVFMDVTVAVRHRFYQALDGKCRDGRTH